MPQKTASTTRRSRRGRPLKYGGPSQIVAITLPHRIVETLHRLHSDLGWAIVSLVEKAVRSSRHKPSMTKDVQLLEVDDGQFLIVVNSALFHALPGAQLVPLSATQAFLALEPGRGITDLELAVLDRLERLKTPGRERQAVASLGDQLRKWRRDPHLLSHTRSMIIVTKRRPAR